MSKKTLLNEQTIRRFGGLAGIRPTVTSNFLTEVEVGEDELADALAAGAEAMADVLELDVSVQVDSAGDAGEEVDDLEDEYGELEGEEDAIDDELGGLGDEEEELEDEEGAIDDEMGAIDDEETDIEDETLEELINRILQEDEDEDNVDVIEEEEEELEERAASKKKDQGGRDYRGFKDTDPKYKPKRRGDSHGDQGGSDYTNSPQQEGHIKVVDDEYIMQEVSRRVKHRLANLVKENRRRQRRPKRRK